MSALAPRSERLVEQISSAGSDLLLVTNLLNVRYLTGYTGTNGLALIGPDTRVFVTDFRYVEQAADEVDPSFERVRAPQDLIESVGSLLPEAALRLGFDDAYMSVKDHARLRELLDERVELVAAAGLVERLRLVKSAQEVDQIAAATRIADEALAELLATGLVGRTERELATALEHGMRQRGAQDAGFPSIVAAGAHGALPHAQPREVPVKRGDLVVFDWGARLAGYHSDCTRTVAAGEASAEAREVYAVVLAAQLAGLAAVGVGVSGRDADAAAREVIEAAGHGEHFGHGLGHGVGLEIHEAPRLSQRSEDTLAAGNVVTVEPGVYLPGQFGIRIEDLVVVQDSGPLVLTGLSKELLVVD